MNKHPLQENLFDELHSRPFPLLSSPVSVSHWVMLDPGDPAVELKHIANLARQYSVSPPEQGASCYYTSLGEFEFRWERHTEFSSYMVIVPCTGEQPFNETALSVLPAAWISDLSGSMIGGEHIELRSNTGKQIDTQSLHPYFEGQSLMGSRVLDDKASLWTSLRSYSDGFCRILVYTESEDLCECGRLVRSLIELSAYRNLTLIALPIARNLIPVVSGLEFRLAELTQRLTDAGNFKGEKLLLEELSAFAAELERLVSDNNFRFAATEAYYRLSEDRLLELNEQPLHNLRTLEEFHQRRFRPGFSTCQSVRSRMNDLSVRVNRSSSLLRTRVDLILESQNQDLLRSMDRRAKLQIRMQQTVEGLSIIAMTHYTLSLLGYLLKAVPVELMLVSSDIILAASTPVIFAAAWLSVRRIRKRFSPDELEEG
ncbi:MAG TPA: DUF3422 family protein [Porticoccus sp.]|nr:DUF3422 family protein [Porticoccus sp.]